MPSIVTYPDQVKQVFALLRNGSGNLVNNNATTINPLLTRLNAIKTTAEGYVPTPAITNLIAALENNIEKMDDTLAVTNMASGVVPVDNTLTSYGYESRLGILQAALNVKQSDLDQTDTETLADKVTKCFGPIAGTNTATYANLDSILTILETNISETDMNLVAAAQTSALNINTAQLTSSLTSINSGIEEEVERLQQLGLSATLFSASNDSILYGVLSATLSPNIKVILNIP